MLQRVLILALAAGCALPAAAHPPTNHGAHVHGEAQAQLVLEGAQLSLELTAPGASVVGFERAARSADETAHVREVAAWFERPDDWLQPDSRAGCRLVMARVDVDAFTASGAPRSGHADLLARYAWNCETPARLDSLRISLFARFPALERLRVDAITDTAQGGDVLTPARPSLRLPR